MFSVLYLELILAIVFLIFIPIVEFAPVASDAQAMNYLSRFGYIDHSEENPSRGALVDGDLWNKAISDFQSFAGLSITGQLNNETIKTMTLPRCGVRDIEVIKNTKSQSYVLQGSRWTVKNLSYKISKYPRYQKLSREDVDKEIRRAFNIWAEHTDLTFTQHRTGEVHIEIKFVIGEHGDGDPFDGRGGTLAHAYFPTYGGDAHFDDAEEWTVKSFRGTNLFQVAAHELGHSLGLSHSNVKSALMAPFYREFNPSLQLDNDDITGIQNNPVTPPTSIPPSNPTTPDASDAEICSNPNIDAIFKNADGDSFVFIGMDYYKLTEHGIAPGYPQLISKTWLGLPGNIDAAFTYTDNKTYFFKGSKYWQYVGTRMVRDYPKEINKGFSGIPDKVDAAFVWSGNGKIYFFKGDKFWRSDSPSSLSVNSTYPKPISNSDTVPNNYSTAFQYTNGYTYFLKEDANFRFSVDRADPAFSRWKVHWMLGCKSAVGLPVDLGDPNSSFQIKSSLFTLLFIAIWYLKIYV